MHARRTLGQTDAGHTHTCIYTQGRQASTHPSREEEEPDVTPQNTTVENTLPSGRWAGRCTERVSHNESFPLFLHSSVNVNQAPSRPLACRETRRFINRWTGGLIKLVILHTGGLQARQKINFESNW